ncbi:hypothetical protein LP032_116 [Listeria phage LP-032]|uniref:Uncharacterized protein n=11 Tax=Homburgvirus TaxID=1921125 RepID=A0A6C0R1X6_9CAUD|nr:hypothetical protein P70_0069 [Listeria phage P70]YP_008240379.1 hypothetical protein LP110_015 [Listeria phage LP-110]YP_008240521.1 hypothetical protein LP037_043 [Listeria phage LP-037]YP_009044134.1 hypothetical protein LP026_049 [Listeria phage LP-026]YP_009045104.1 hypothetical protein LP114_050 [Listeria phage LP-114]AHL18965.1 hypothetical protein LP032_116 [Listeria phage LP-032]AWY07709.1 hypothetical protein [Listeria phage LP-KV022]QDK04572.1 hypothetical protein FK481_0058 [L
MTATSNYILLNRASNALYNVVDKSTCDTQTKTELKQALHVIHRAMMEENGDIQKPLSTIENKTLGIKVIENGKETII